MGHCCSKEIFLDKFIGALILCQNERNLSILALILILAAFLFLLHIFGVKATPIKGSPLSQGLSYTPACFVSLSPFCASAPVKSKKIIQVSGVETLRWISSGFLMFSVEPKIL